jgi:hypothetical protein
MRRSIVRTIVHVVVRVVVRGRWPWLEADLFVAGAADRFRAQREPCASEKEFFAMHWAREPMMTERT